MGDERRLFNKSLPEGKAMSLALAEAGAQVAVVSRNTEQAQVDSNHCQVNYVAALQLAGADSAGGR